MSVFGNARRHFARYLRLAYAWDSAVPGGTRQRTTIRQISETKRSQNWSNTGSLSIDAMKRDWMSISRDHWDVIVVGGGTAGLIAGIASARSGARTLIIERGGFLGGNAATGMNLGGFF
jgi:NADPH-dependent 2,4-dienoyl-CoA reductase/sulfur reductase-like enzyme